MHDPEEMLCTYAVLWIVQLEAPHVRLRQVARCCAWLSVTQPCLSDVRNAPELSSPLARGPEPVLRGAREALASSCATRVRGSRSTKVRFRLARKGSRATVSAAARDVSLSRFRRPSRLLKRRS